MLDLPDKLGELSARIDTKDVGFVPTADGKDKSVLCPFHWLNDFAVVEIQIDSESLDRVREITAPLELIPEDLIWQFFTGVRLRRHRRSGDLAHRRGTLNSLEKFANHNKFAFGIKVFRNNYGYNEE